MKKYKVCVYAIAKNEEKFVDRWVNSMKEADEIYVLDTGSKDKTVKKLKKLGVKVKIKKIKQWRFDIARNLSLEMVPKDTDICVCTDLDEIFMPGWRKILEKNWNDNTTRARYTYNWSLNDDDVPLVTFYIEKIHSRNNYKWINPVHEVLKSDTQESFVTIDDIVVNHYPDSSKSRSSYLPLLELAVSENPENDRNMHYLGREYMYYRKWNECIDTLIKHLNLKSATWKDERCASMRFIARSYQALKRYDEAKMWLDKAMKEAPYLRDPFVERAILAYDLNEWEDVNLYGEKAIKIEYHPKTYINEPFSFDSTIYDLLAISNFHLKNYEKAIEYSNKALEINPNDERLLSNHSIYITKKEFH